MTAFPGWQKYVVPQRRLETGCIPTAYEILVRAAGIPNIDVDSFQEDFDLDKEKDFDAGDKPENNFTSVAAAVRKKYPKLVFERKVFDTGDEKVAFIEERIAQQQPVLVSLAMAPLDGHGWHIMPVVDADDEIFTLLMIMTKDGKTELMKINKQLVAEIHDKADGGKDVAFLNTEWGAGGTGSSPQGTLPLA